MGHTIYVEHEPERVKKRWFGCDETMSRSKQMLELLESGLGLDEGLPTNPGKTASIGKKNGVRLCHVHRR
jgi:hypothetical protein